jgi:hypothetical protein
MLKKSRKLPQLRRKHQVVAIMVKIKQNNNTI